MKAIAMLIALVASAAFAQGASMNCRYGSSCSVGQVTVGSDILFRTGNSGTSPFGDPTLNCIGWGPAVAGNTWWMCGKPNVSLTIGNNNSAYTSWRLSDGFLLAGNGIESAQFKSTRASGSDAFYVSTNGARWHFGIGATDYASSDGTTVTFAGPISVSGTITTSGSNSITAGGGLIGQFLAVNANNLPANGMHLPAANVIEFSTASTGRVRIDSTGIYPTTDAAIPLGKTGNTWSAATVAGKVLSNANSGSAFQSAGAAFDSFSTCDSTQKGGTIFDTLNNEQRQCGGSKWATIGAGSHWTSQRKTLVINPFSAEGTLCPRCTECHSTTLTAFDGQTCTDSAAGTTSIVDLVDFRNFNTTAVANNTSSWITRTTETRRNQGPRATFRVYVAAITSERVWYGLSSVALNGADAPVGHIAAFRFSTNATDTTWQACTGDGVTTTCANTGLTVTANVGYELEIDCRPSGSCFFGAYRLDGSASSQLQANKKTTNLPTLTTALSVRHYCETLTTAARTCGLGPSALETQ